MASYHCMLAQFGGPLSRTMSIHVSVNFTERGSWKLAFSLSSNSLHLPSVYALRPLMKPVPMLATLGVPRATMPGSPVFFFTRRRLGHLLQRRRHLDIVLVENVLAIG